MLRSVLVVATLAALGGCTGAGGAEEDCWWIGSINPLTGDLGTVGLALENAARLAVQDVNAAGKIGGKSLCIATGDTRTNPNRAAPLVEALIERNDIRALNGAAESSSTLEAAKVTTANDMAIVSCCSTSPLVGADPNIYRTVPSDALQGVALAEIAAARQSDRVAIIYLNDSYGIPLRDQFKSAYLRLRPAGTITHEIAYDSGADSYAAVVRDALTDVPQVVVLIAFPIAGAEIIKAWRESRLAPDVSWLATDGLKDSKFVFLTGDGMPAVIGTAPTPSGPFYAGFEARYKRAFGGELPGIFTPNQYDAVILIALAMAAASPDPEPADIKRLIPEISRGGGERIHADDLERALEAVTNGGEVDYFGVSGPVDLDATGDVLGGYRVWSIAAGGGPIAEESACYACAADNAGVIQCNETTAVAGGQCAFE